MRKVVCLSTSNYYPFPTRKQNVMNRLHDAEVLYFDPPVTWLAPLKDKKAKERLTAWKKPGQKAKENITVYALPPILPFGTRFRWINRLNQKRQAAFVRKKMKAHGFSDPLLWCYNPTAADITAHIPHDQLVYDCVDRHSAYTGTLNPVVVDAMEKDLATQADIVFCTALGLYETLSKENPNTWLIPNGAAYELFSQADGEPDPGQKVIYGFVGMLQDCIAYDYLLALADACPEDEIWMIGRIMPGVDISELEKRPNIKLLGLKKQEELPAIMRQFRVCLNVFAPGRLSRDVSPLKFYEYLATGKPVVTTPEPLQVKDYADIVAIANSPEEFVRCCKAAAVEHNDALREKRLAAGKAASWDNRVKEMETILNQEG